MKSLRIKTSRDFPEEIFGEDYAFPSFNDGKVFAGKKKRLPAMGWNSWNAFGSGNTEELTKAMADKMIELGLDKLGYSYLVLDDGCYKSERVNGHLSNEEVKFPSGFYKLGEYIHNKGLKFGMYNDIGTNLCAGAAVGTCGFEDIDAKDYVDWDIDFLKVDNCYYLWDNATFSNPENARFVYAPKIKGIDITKDDFFLHKDAVCEGILWGEGAIRTQDYVMGIGTFDGTGSDRTPVGTESSELRFIVSVPLSGEYELVTEYASGRENLVGQWLQVAVINSGKRVVYFDNFVDETVDKDTFVKSKPVKVFLNQGENTLVLMNHRRQENTLNAYATMFNALKEKDGGKDILLSICEWGKTQPQNWGYKIGDSWRILNDITFAVGSDGNPGGAEWEGGYTNSITSQYNKAVIMDEFSGPEKGYNDPDMLVIGMNGTDDIINKTHMVMWCMMNSPLMLGMDLRRVNKGDNLYRVIANSDFIALNQDSLGIQAKRVYSTICKKNADKTYLRDNQRQDILVKPLSDDSFAVSFINLSKEKQQEEICLTKEMILEAFWGKEGLFDNLFGAKKYKIKDLWTKEEYIADSLNIKVSDLSAHDSITYKVSPISD